MTENEEEDGNHNQTMRSEKHKNSTGCANMFHEVC